MAKGDRAEDALCDLNMAYAIIAICEGGVFRTQSGRRLADKLVRQCKEHAGRQFYEYERKTVLEARP